MKKLLLIAWCLVLASQGLVGMNNNNPQGPKEKELRALYEKAKQNKNYEGKAFDSTGSFDEFIQLRNQVLEEEHLSFLQDKIINEKSKELINKYDSAQDEQHKDKKFSRLNQDKPPVTYYGSEFTRMKFAEDAKDLMQEEVAKKKGFKNYNQLVGKEHAQQQFYAQEEFKKLKRENRTINSIATDIQDAFWDKTIDFAAQATVEKVIVPLVLPPLEEFGRFVRKIIDPERVKKEREWQLVQESIQLEESALNGKEKDAHTKSYVRDRFLQMYNINTVLLEQKGLDKNKQKALKKELDLINQEFSIMLNPSMLKKQEAAQKFKDKLESLCKKYNISYDDLERIDQQDQLEQDILINTKNEIEALKQLVDFAEQSSDRKSAQFMNTVVALQELAKNNGD